MHPRSNESAQVLDDRQTGVKDYGPGATPQLIGKIVPLVMFGDQVCCLLGRVDDEGFRVTLTLCGARSFLDPRHAPLARHAVIRWKSRRKLL